MRKIYLLTTFFIFILSSCSNLRKQERDFSELDQLLPIDYVEHLGSLSQAYLLFNQGKIKKISKRSEQYLREIHDRIVKNNEIFLSKRDIPSFYILDNSSPFMFSLPNSHFFISHSLISKFLKNEQLFVAALSREIIRAQRNVYEKKFIINTGNISTDDMMKLMKLRSEIKFKINEWAYIVLKRTGYDASALLAWIQLQNKNPLDFSMYIGDRATISREEYFFKNFLVNDKKSSAEVPVDDEMNSSKDFYNLLNDIKDK